MKTRWEINEVIGSDEGLIECAKRHGFNISKKKDPRIKLIPCVCGAKRISTYVCKNYLHPFRGVVCRCPKCGLKVCIDKSKEDPKDVDWDKLEQEARLMWNDLTEKGEL